MVVVVVLVVLVIILVRVLVRVFVYALLLVLVQVRVLVVSVVLPLLICILVHGREWGGNGGRREGGVGKGNSDIKRVPRSHSLNLSLSSTTSIGTSASTRI